MNEESLLNDSELGRISIHHNARAKQMTFRCKDGQLACTVPVHATGRDVALAVDKLRDRLRRLLQRTGWPSLAAPHRKLFTAAT